MSISKKSVRLVLFITVLIVTAVVFGGAGFHVPTAAADDAEKVTAPEAGFAANAGTLGAIPDSDVATPTCQNNSTTQRNVTFSVSGMTGTVTSVAVNFTATHSYVQDLEVTLIAPNGANHLLFSATGTTSTTANACGSHGNNLLGTYNFADSASTNWWTTAAASTNITPSTNRTVVTGIGGIPSGVPATTSLNSAFTGVSPSGTWTLRFRDRGAGDTGSVTAANLTINTTTSQPQHVADYDGDGRTDYVVVRNTGGGAGGQVTWFVGTQQNQFTAQPWGISTDFFLSQSDYDGDQKTDITVWRPSAAQAYFYILQSSNNTLRAVPFGVTGDDPTVEQDYTGDGKADPAVYRGGESAGERSYWYYLASSGPLNGQIVVTQWGQNGDFPAPGDYNGDDKGDFGIQRNGGNGSGVFFVHNGTGGPDVPSDPVVTYWGTSSDLILPGDYDGDGKTDLCVARGSGGQILWYVLNSSNGSVSSFAWGLSATDFPTQGDYDGDGRTDVAIWRPNASPPENAFYINGTSSGVTARQWGLQGDYPVANSNSH